MGEAARPRGDDGRRAEARGFDLLRGSHQRTVLAAGNFVFQNNSSFQRDGLFFKNRLSVTISFLILGTIRYSHKIILLQISLIGCVIVSNTVDTA